MNKEKINSNIWKLYFIRGFRSFMLFTPIIVLFFQENGLSMNQIFLLQAVFSIASIILEIPAGYFSDVFGQRKSIIIGSIASVLGFVIYSLSPNFWFFMLAEITLGIGSSFISGSDSALLYETLLVQKKPKEYKKTEGRLLGVMTFSESIASIIGGFLALISLRVPLYCEVFVTLGAVPVAFSLMEPRIKSKQPGNILQEASSFLFKEKKVKWLVIYSSFIGASTLVMFWLTQPYLLAVKIPIAFFGVFLAVGLLITSFFSWNVHKIEKILGTKKALILLVFLPAIGYLILSSFQFVWSVLFIFIFYIVRGLNNPITLDYINSLINSNSRATILSAKNLLTRLVFSIAGPFIGLVNDTFSLKMALLLSGIIFFVFGVLSLFFMKKHKVI